MARMFARVASSFSKRTALLVLLCPVFACEAELETGCRDGDCEEYPPPVESQCPDFTLSPPPPECRPASETGDLPCDVQWVLESTCQGCHIEGGMGPFPLVTYENTQVIYGAKPIWSRMKTATNKEGTQAIKMPQNAFPAADCKLDILGAWFETCEAGECLRRSQQPGMGGAPPSNGGAGGTGNGGTGNGGAGDTGGAGGAAGGP